MPPEKKKRCHNGHLLRDPNLIYRVRPNGRETRECKKCAMQRQAAAREAAKRKAKRKGKVVANKAVAGTVKTVGKRTGRTVNKAA